MSTITIRDIPETAYAQLKVIAAKQKGQKGRRSVEGFARGLLVEAAARRVGTGFGDLLVAISRSAHADLAAAGEDVTNEEIDALFKRSDEQGEPASFE